MKKVDFNKLQAGDLVEVPRTQFAPMRSGWNGWLFSEAVVIRKGVGRKSKRKNDDSRRLLFCYRREGNTWTKKQYSVLKSCKHWQSGA